MKVIFLGALSLLINPIAFSDQADCMADKIWKEICAPKDQMEFFCDRLGSNPNIMDQFKISYKQQSNKMQSGPAAKLASGGFLSGPFSCP